MRSAVDIVCGVLKPSRRTLLLTHARPDGDAVGSILGLALAFRDMGGKYRLWLPACPSKYAFLKPGDLSAYSPAEGWEPELICCLDAASAERIEWPDRTGEGYRNIDVLNIDHHPDNSRFGRWNAVDPTLAATACIVFKALLKMDWKISHACADSLLTGMVMDSGGYRFQNTDPELFRLSAELIERGAAYHRLMNELFFSREPALVKFESEIVNTCLSSAFDGQFLWVVIDKGLYEKYGVKDSDTEALIDSIRQIKGARAVATLQPVEHGTRVSLRSKDPSISVADIARELGGGGHEMAAGATLEGADPEKAEKILLEKIKGIFE